MRCFICAKLSLPIICTSCHNKLLIPNITTRKLGNLKVISLFKYSEISILLLTKHKPEGYRVYRYLGKKFMKPFIEEFVSPYNKDIYIIGIDEVIKGGYSHVAILTNSMKTKLSKPLYASLIATNSINYAGRDLEFRLDNPRDFIYKGSSNIEVVLVDDLITTGLTIQEAKELLLEYNVTVLFALTLGDASDD
ncbi:MAG: ComF family protein [Sulfurovum sp.]